MAQSSTAVAGSVGYCLGNIFTWGLPLYPVLSEVHSRWNEIFCGGYGDLPLSERLTLASEGVVAGVAAVLGTLSQAEQLHNIASNSTFIGASTAASLGGSALSISYVAATFHHARMYVQDNNDIHETAQDIRLLNNYIRYFNKELRKATTEKILSFYENQDNIKSNQEQGYLALFKEIRETLSDNLIRAQKNISDAKVRLQDLLDVTPLVNTKIAVESLSVYTLQDLVKLQAEASFYTGSRADINWAHIFQLAIDKKINEFKPNDAQDEKLDQNNVDATRQALRQWVAAQQQVAHYEIALVRYQGHRFERALHIAACIALLGLSCALTAASFGALAPVGIITAVYIGCAVTQMIAAYSLNSRRSKTNSVVDTMRLTRPQRDTLQELESKKSPPLLLFKNTNSQSSQDVKSLKKKIDFKPLFCSENEMQEFLDILRKLSKIQHILANRRVTDILDKKDWTAFEKFYELKALASSAVNSIPATMSRWVGGKVSTLIQTIHDANPRDLSSIIEKTKEAYGINVRKKTDLLAQAEEDDKFYQPTISKP